jgi:site-specific recombinase XerD
MNNGITLKLFLLKRKQKANGETPVYLRLTKNRKYRMISTGIAVQEKHWNESSQQVRKNHPRNNVLNAQLDDILSKAKETVWDMPDEMKSITEVKKALKNTDTGLDFLSYSQQVCEMLLQDKRVSAYKNTKVTLRFFRDYIGKQSIAFDEITADTLHGFQGYLSTPKMITVNGEPVKKHGNSANTVYNHFKNIKRIYKKALLDEVTKSNPFLKFQPIQKERTDKARLTFQQVRAIEAIEVKFDTSINVTRDAFMFSFYNAGIRFGDVARLKWKHIIDGRLKYNMSKTGTGKNINLLKPALAILDKYRPNIPNKEAFIFPILDTGFDYSDEAFLKAKISSKNVIVNRNLKILARMAGIEENVCFHVARHSFADYARTSGMDIYNISKALGHADITITQVYLKSFDETSLDEAMETIFKDKD